MAIRDNLKAFLEDLDSAALQYGRETENISIMAVSKTRTVEEIIEARNAGLDLFGENRVEEAAEKFATLDTERYPLVLIGHLQGNKVKHIDGRFGAVHSVHSLKLARKLSQRRQELGAELAVLLQVNTSGEEAKSGFREKLEFLDVAAEVAEMPFLSLGGVMTMAPFVDDEAVVRRCFAECRQWSEELGGLTDGPVILSMGMSSDYRWAVAEGSNLLRIGTTLFGARY